MSERYTSGARVEEEVEVGFSASLVDYLPWESIGKQAGTVRASEQQALLGPDH